MQKYVIYCPLQVADQDGLPCAYAFNVVGILTDKLTAAFGGATVDNCDAYGYWETPDLNVVLDRVAMVHVLVASTEDWNDKAPDIMRWLKSYTNQQQMLVTMSHVEVIRGF
mgnify:CR=1 FL=1|jgi:hypothetical protein